MSPLNRFQMPLPERKGADGEDEEALPLVRPTRSPTRRLPEPFAPIAIGRDIACSGCGRTCRYEASLSDRPESPEFLKSGGIWLGFSVDPDTETLSCIAACSETCLSRLLRE